MMTEKEHADWFNILLNEVRGELEAAVFAARQKLTHDDKHLESPNMEVYQMLKEIMRRL